MSNINKDVVEIFTSNVVWLRKTNSLSKVKMCKILGIGYGSLNKIEKGILPPKLSVDVIFRIARYFGISAGNLVGEKLNEESKLDKAGH